MSSFKPNQIVRLKNDPGKQGLVTDAEPRIIQGGQTIIFEINFLTSGIRRIPADQLELVPDNQSPTDHIRLGKFGDLRDIRNQIIHLKMNGHMADLLYSLEATNTEFHAYQFKPVIKILNSPSGNIFIADEVGLGKTIEAGLIWTELKARFDFNRLMVLCPNSLRYKWDMELSEKFGLSPRIVDAKELNSIFNRDGHPNREQALIGGFQSLRPRKDWQDKEERELISADKIMRFLENRENPEPLFDLLVVDESHHVRNEESTQHKMVSMLRSVSDQAVFLSATPVHLKSPDLFNQLKILDPDQFQDLDEFDGIITANIPIQNARDALVNPKTTPANIMDHLRRAQQTPILSGSRAIEALIQKIDGLNDDDGLSHKFRAELASDLERANLLSNILTRTRRKDVQDFRIQRTVIDKPVDQTEIEAELYRCVTEIISEYALGKDINKLFLLAMPQKMLTSSMPSTVRYWRERMAGRVLSDEPDELDFNNNDDDAVLPDDETPLTQLIGEETSNFDLTELENNDSKYLSFKVVLDEYIQLNEKVILFSTFKSTLEYLRRRLAQDGFKSYIIHGGVQDRDMVLRDFENTNDPSVLLSSEVGSEGLDLQFCRVLFNYDLPWNPTRIEQRIGRIDRFGQKAEKIAIYNLMYAGTIDQRIYDRLGVRQNLIENTLGEFEAILGQEINKLTRSLIAGKRSVEEENQLIDQTALAFQHRKIVEIELEEEAAGLIAHGDYILQQVKAAQELNRWISDEDLKIYLSGFLDRFFPQTLITFDQDDPIEFEINMESALRTELQAFIIENRKQGQTRLTESRRHRCRFGKVIESSRGQNLEVINQMHPLLRLAAKKFGEADTPNVRPATAITISSSYFNEKQTIPPGDYLIAIARWSTSGTQRLEKIAYKMISLETGKYFEPDDAELITTELLYHGKGIADPESKFDLDVTSKRATDLFDQLQESFDIYTDQKRSENYDRADLQLKSLTGQFKRQSARIRELIQKYNQNSNRGLQRIQENKLDKLQTNLDVRREKIERNKEIYGESEDVTAIVARIE